MIMRSISSLGNKGGLSLIEVLVMVLLVSMVLITVPASFRGASQVWENNSRHNEVMQNARMGMEELTRELRQAKEILAVSQSFDPIGFIEFRYEHDVDGDGDKVYKYQRYEYKDDYMQHAWSCNGATDLSSILNPLAGPIGNLTFTCYDKLGQLVTIPDDIGRISMVIIKIITYDELGKVNPIPISSGVYIRSS